MPAVRRTSTLGSAVSAVMIFGRGGGLIAHDVAEIGRGDADLARPPARPAVAVRDTQDAQGVTKLLHGGTIARYFAFCTTEDCQEACGYRAGVSSKDLTTVPTGCLGPRQRCQRSARPGIRPAERGTERVGAVGQGTTSRLPVHREARLAIREYLRTALPASIINGSCRSTRRAAARSNSCAAWAPYCSVPLTVSATIIPLSTRMACTCCTGAWYLIGVRTPPSASA